MTNFFFFPPNVMKMQWLSQSMTPLFTKVSHEGTISQKHSCVRPSQHNKVHHWRGKLLILLVTVFSGSSPVISSLVTDSCQHSSSGRPGEVRCGFATYSGFETQEAFQMTGTMSSRAKKVYCSNVKLPGWSLAETESSIQSKPKHLQKLQVLQ